MFKSRVKGLVLAAIAGLAAAGCSGELDRGSEGGPEVKRAVFETPDGARSLSYVERNGYAVVEGDILFALPEERSLQKSSLEGERSQQSATENGFGRWPGGIVPYEVDPALPNPGRVTEAIARVQSGTQIRFIARNGHADYVRFVPIPDGPACYSALGRVGGRQDIQLAPACSAGSTAHEIGHALGLIHEHQRTDRDSFIRIFLDRVDPQFRYAFNTDTWAAATTGYDTASIMHYPSTAFAMGSDPTITRLDGSLIPYPEYLSNADRAGLNAMYANPATGRPVGSAVAAASWGGLRVDLFWRGTYGDVQHRWIDAGPNRGWSHAESLGSPLGKPFFFDPSAVSYGSGHVEVFVVGADNAVWHKWFINGAWSGWESLGGQATSSPSAASLHYGHIDLFVRGADMGLWHRWQDWPAGAGWQNWSSLGGGLRSGPAAVAPNFAFQQAGKDRLFVFVVADNGALYGIGWSPAGWGGWVYMGEEGSFTSDLTAVSLGPDNVNLFWRGTQQQLVHKYWNGSAWSSRLSYDGVMGEAPRATTYGNQQLAIFAPSSEWQTAYVKTWGPGAGFASFNPVFDGWALCGGLTSGQPLWSMASVLSCDGRFRFAQQADGNLVLFQGAQWIWQSGRFGSGFSTTMQADGNLVTYGSGGPVWSSNTFGNNGAHFAVQNDGNSVIYATSGAPVWSTGTCCR